MNPHSVEPLLLNESLSGVRAGLTRAQPWELVGLHSPLALALLLLQPSVQAARSPHVVVFPEEKDLDLFEKCLHFFDPHMPLYRLPSFDVDLYSGLYPSHKVIGQRLHWLHHARNASGGAIFATTIRGLCQKTLPYQLFAERALHFSKSDSLPDTLTRQLEALGYQNVPTVEDVGTFAMRGGILDVYSPAHSNPVRIELFGDIIDSIRGFDPETQRSLGDRDSFSIIPAREVLYRDEALQAIVRRFQQSLDGRDVNPDETRELVRQLSQGQTFFGVDLMLPFFYSDLSSPLEYFNEAPFVWSYHSFESLRVQDEFLALQKAERETATQLAIAPDYTLIYETAESLTWPDPAKVIRVERVRIEDSARQNLEVVDFKTFSVQEFAKTCQGLSSQSDAQITFVGEKLRAWRESGYAILVSCHSQNIAQRLSLLLEKCGFQTRMAAPEDYHWSDVLESARREPALVHLIPRPLPDSGRFAEDRIVFLRDEDFWGRKQTARRHRNEGTLTERAQALSFGDIKPGDFVVHKQHGIGVYDGLTVMDIDGVAAEYIQLRYKDNDKLYLPVYRVGQLQKYSGPSSGTMIDKLGGPGWGKVTSKVKKQVRDIAASLLKLYARRAQIKRPPFSSPDDEFIRFESTFPYEETEDQLKAIQDVLADMQKPTPMDRLICGDVGFGKTEVALRAAFKAVEDGKQVALIAPTTILTFQHFETFKKRFKSWPVEIRALNRFVSTKDIKKTLVDLQEGKVDILIGTHRLLSKDVQFKDLGLLIVDEEQKFGVVHKERLRHLRENVDTLAMSATPIPRTLNMSLVGIRDLSIINTPPEDRLPTRTFISKFDPEMIRKAISSEIQRGGQVFFLHNRVQSIYELTDRLRSILPDARIGIGHGQMEEHELEKTMLKFFNHELDVLVCTAIIESGMDIPKANTIFIDNAQQLGVSQLYQLRGRVGRSKERAYCYLLVPADRKLDANTQERIRIIQENTALGSGIQVAHYDLELRGAGDLLGAEQSGHINAVGYEMYLDLLEEAVREQKGEPAAADHDVEPEINLRIPALIPDRYIPDIRIRLSYYKALSNIDGPEDLDRIEDELRDQFGAPPEPVMNLMGLMLIRKQCRDLGVRDISAGKAALTLAFTEKTPMPPAEVVRLTAMENKKYQLTPDQRLKIRMNEITWPRVHDELSFLLKLCPARKS